MKIHPYLFVTCYHGRPTLFLNLLTERANYAVAIRLFGKALFRICLDGGLMDTTVDWLWLHFVRKRVLPCPHT